MTQLAGRDELTRLHTRAAFEADLRRLAAAEREPGAFALLLCDLDYLKLINDTFGHLAGDEALRGLAATLRSHLRPGWQVYRLGGDEFAVLALVGGEALAEWGGDVLERLADRPDRPLRVSMGVAAWTPDLEGPQALFALADARLYAAKRLGRGQVVQADTPAGPGGAVGPSRLLGRDEARADIVAFFQRALGAPGARLTVHAPPGGGLSAFLREANLIAQTLGYQTLSVQGDPARAARDHETWEGAALNGVPLRGSLAVALRERRSGAAEAPLALLLDAPDLLGAAAHAELAPLLAGAQAIVSGQAAAWTGESSGPHLLTLPPLSERSVLALAEAQLGPLGEAGAAWLLRQVQGRPARLAPQLSALQLEAELRCQSVAELTAGPSATWEAAVARHVPSPASPPQPHLHGRSAEVREAARLLGSHALLSVTGPAGRGKTRLAQQLLAELAPQYPGGAHVVALRGVTLPEVALARIAETLLGTPVAPVGVDTLTRLLRRRPTLLLLDDAAPQACPARTLEALLSRSPGTRVIVTGRAALGVQGEATLALAPLGDADVSAALGALAAPAAGDTGPDLDALTRHVAGEPDTLAALLPLVQMFGLRGAAGYLGRSGRARRAGGPWAEFGAPERRVLAALGTFEGPFDLGWAADVSGGSPFLLSALIHRHVLLPVGSGLYRLPEGLLTHARAHLGARAGIQRRAAGRGLSRALRAVQAHPPESAAWFAHLDLHYPTLRALLSGLLRGGAAPDPALVEVLLALTPYRLTRVHLYDAREDLQAALAALPEDPAGSRAGEHAALRLALASTLQRLGEHGEAHALAREARAGAEAVGDRPLQTAALLTEARVLHRRSAYEEAHALFGAVRDEAQDVPGAAPLLVRALGGLARSALYLGHLDVAQQNAEAALALSAPLNRPLLCAELLNTAALIATERRDLGEAQALLERALALHDACGGREGQTLNLTGLAWVALLRGDYALSVQYSGRVLHQAQDSGQGWEVANALVNLGHALARLGDLEGARTRHAEAARLAAGCDAPSIHAEALGGLADVYARQGQRGVARALLDLALSHPGANAEVHSFFAGLRDDLAGEVPAALPPELQPLTLAGSP